MTHIATLAGSGRCAGSVRTQHRECCVDGLRVRRRTPIPLARVSERTTASREAVCGAVRIRSHSAEPNPDIATAMPYPATKTIPVSQGGNTGNAALISPHFVRASSPRHGTNSSGCCCHDGNFLRRCGKLVAGGCRPPSVRIGKAATATGNQFTEPPGHLHAGAGRADRLH